MRLTDEELIAQIEAEEALSATVASQLAGERKDAIDRYLGAPLGNEVEGRSQVVDRSIADTVEWIVPSLARIFMGGDEIGRFDPIGPEDEQPAEMETLAVNWYLENRNDFYSQFSAIVRDALLLKNGYAAVYWNVRKDVITETYTGLSDEEAAMLLQDQDVKAVEHTQVPGPVMQGPQGPMPTFLHDIKVERTRADEYPAVESVPPDEIIVSRAHRWTSLLDADFVQWRRPTTVGQARAEGFDVPLDTPFGETNTNEWAARDRYYSEGPRDDQDGTNDPTRTRITLKDTYIRMDMRGTGTPQLWRVVFVDGSNEVLLREEADVIPFAAFAAIPFPHSHIGVSVYDLLADVGVIKTALTRSYIDNVYLLNGNRTAVDVSRVNVDDLLVSRPGGVIRTEGNPAEAMMPLATPDATGGILQGLEYLETVKEARTGVTRYSAGLDANTLNKTATGVQQIQAAANQRIELIARTMAGGFKDLFLIIHALACKHSTKPIQMKLKGKWVPIDPRSWAKRTDFSISVGLGTGTPQEQLMKLQALQPLMQQAMQMQLAGPLEAYEYGKELLKAAGYKNPDKFLKPPQPAVDQQTGQPMMGPDGKPQYQMPPPPKDPMVQAEEIKAQVKQGEVQANMQAKAQEAQFKHQSDMQRLAAEQEVQRSNDERQAALDQQKFNAEQQAAMRDHELEVLRLQKEYEFKVWEKEYDAQLQRELKGMEMQTAVAGQNDYKGLADLVKQMHANMSSPSEVVRDANGKVVGIKRGNTTQTVRRDENGRVIGVH